MDELPQIKWGKIKSLTVDDLTINVVYDDGKKVSYTFTTKNDMLKVLENRLENDD